MLKLSKIAQNRRQLLKGAALGAFVGVAGSALPMLSTSAFAQEAKLGEKVEGLYDKTALEDNVMGSADAPITMVEYASMTCGHCANFHTKILPELKEKYIDTGKVKLIFREFPFDPLATAAFMLGRCAPDGKNLEMVDVLFNQQDTWTRTDDPAAALLKIARLAGFTKDSFEKCLSDQELLTNINEVKDRAVDKFKVSATPTFFINEQRYEGPYTAKALGETFDSLGAN